ncbi:Uu.00g124910.m01.CDS01 [Anthostomella pinea]|uniref:Uu.00g124910.m01.CDS01 n=1 Tax=Anthostomella pinea TaxID=933095 RepID=A0AAI8VHP6_9PEZI|nr:Uu.00g124910.m01.CDS01 [Anthostomella pinea]
MSSPPSNHSGEDDHDDHATQGNDREDPNNAPKGAPEDAGPNNLGGVSQGAPEAAVPNNPGGAGQGKPDHNANGGPDAHDDVAPGNLGNDGPNNPNNNADGGRDGQNHGGQGAQGNGGPGNHGNGNQDINNGEGDSDDESDEHWSDNGDDKRTDEEDDFSEGDNDSSSDVGHSVLDDADDDDDTEILSVHSVHNQAGDDDDTDSLSIDLGHFDDDQHGNGQNGNPNGGNNGGNVNKNGFIVVNVADLNQTSRDRDVAMAERDLARSEVTIKEEEVTRQRAIISGHEATIEDLEHQIDWLKNGKPAPEIWPRLLRKFLDGRSNQSYERINRECCQQSNMSMRITTTHPDLTIEVKEVDPRYMRWSCSPAKYRYAYPWSGQHPHRSRNLQSLITQSLDTPFTCTRLRPLHKSLLEAAPFPFEKLPNDIQIRIFKLLLVTPKLIHCITRLDPVNPPVDFPAAGQLGNLYLHRFHFGAKPCFIPRAPQPNHVLSPLLVCKRWLFIGSHAFYGANTFAFSSLGELRKFFTGIGKARAERIVNVELMWHGSILPRASRLHEQCPLPNETQKISQRTAPLVWFTKTRRLRTLLVHIEESAEKRVRRRYELHAKEDWYKDYVDEEEYPGDQLDQRALDTFGRMCRNTDIQPNYRKLRSMRTVHGLDYVNQLRGMKWLRYQNTHSDEHRQSIRDWSFLKDVNSVVTQPKEPREFLLSQLENLLPLTGLELFDPSDDDLAMAFSFYEEQPANYDVDADTDSEISETEYSGRVTAAGSDDGLSSDEDEPAGDGDDGGNDGEDDGGDDDSDDDDDSENSDSPRRGSGQPNNGAGGGAMDLDNQSEHGSSANSDVDMPDVDFGIYPDAGSDVSDSDTDDENEDSSKSSSSDAKSQVSISGVHSDSGDSSVSGSDSESDDDDDPDDTGLNTTISPAPVQVIIDLTADDDDENRSNMFDNGSSSESLFVRKGSCSARTLTISGRSSDEMPRAQSELIDLTKDEDDDDDKKPEPIKLEQLLRAASKHLRDDGLDGDSEGPPSKRSRSSSGPVSSNGTTQGRISKTPGETSSIAEASNSISGDSGEPDSNAGNEHTSSDQGSIAEASNSDSGDSGELDANAGEEYASSDEGSVVN